MKLNVAWHVTHVWTFYMLGLNKFSKMGAFMGYTDTDINSKTMMLSFLQAQNHIP